MNYTSPAVGLVLAITLAGVVGFLAMTRPTLAMTLQKVYAPGIYQYGNIYRFDMSTRAMSVFAGYDQASMTYAIGILLSTFILLNHRSLLLKSLSIIMSFCLFCAIITSARIGFVAFIFAFIAIFAIYAKRRSGYFIMCIGFVGFIFLVANILKQNVFVDNETIMRFVDVFNLFDFSSSTPFWERSQGVNVVINTQIYGIHYPKGFDIIWGLGDRGDAISDIGYIAIFVKYGIIGITTLFYTFISIGYAGYRIGKKVQGIFTDLPISAFLPGLVIFFVIGSMKGGLYFITYKIGELFAFIIALCLVEAESLRSYSALRNYYNSRHRLKDI